MGPFGNINVAIGDFFPSNKLTTLMWQQWPLKSLPIGEHVPLEDDELT